MFPGHVFMQKGKAVDEFEVALFQKYDTQFAFKLQGSNCYL